MPSINSFYINDFIGVFKISSIEVFKDFIDRIIYLSRLEIEGGALTKAFIDEVNINSDALNLFNRFTIDKFKAWQLKMGVLFDIADFLVAEGGQILHFWMTKVYCFDNDRIKIDVPKSLSPVDSQIVAEYTFSKNEVKMLKKSLAEYKMLDYGGSKAASIIFGSSLKSISKFLSEALNIDYKIFTNKLDITEKKGKITIDYEGAGRVQQ